MSVDLTRGKVRRRLVRVDLRAAGAAGTSGAWSDPLPNPWPAVAILDARVVLPSTVTAARLMFAEDALALEAAEIATLGLSVVSPALAVNDHAACGELVLPCDTLRVGLVVEDDASRDAASVVVALTVMELEQR